MSQNNANDESFANTSNIRILQHNCARSTQIMHACIKFAKNKTDIVILQELWIRDENITISHSSFICIKSNVQNAHVRVLIFVTKNAKKFTCTLRSDIVNSEDMQAISIANNKIQKRILLFNIYNEKSQNADDEQSYMIERELAKVMLNSEQKVIIVEDFNAHHSWWNAKISNFIRTKALISWVNLHKCNLINTSDINTYHSYLSQSSSILDLAFASKNMRNHIKNWHIDENADTEFNHEVILFTIVIKKMKLIENSLNASYNLQKIDWKDFDEHLQKTKDKIIVKMQRITSLEAKVIYLMKCIKNTVKLFVFKQRICAKSKFWWNNELIKRRKTLSSKKRIWKRCRNDDAWAEIVQTRNSYHDAIKLIKNQFWTNFLNNIKEKEVFQTYKFTKSCLIEKLSSIQNLQKELKIEFNEKCETFLKAMYSSFLKIQTNEELLSNESIQWSRVIEGEIKYAINFSALRKALESDEMSFAIIQRAYKTISKIFNLVYSDLIENDYHSKIWREGTRIILKKSDKSNYLISKTYRIITLLNCLGKVAEKIIAVQLSYTAEINNKLLNCDQMKGRKQRSAINAVLNLVHDAQMMKSRENTLICLLLDVKEVFDHVVLKQLVKKLIKLKISINLINWVKCFLQNRIIGLAFDDERQKSKKISTEISQDSFISLILFLIYIRYLFSKIRAKFENLQSLSYIDDVTLYIEGRNIDKNVKMLENAAKIAFTWAENNAVQFDDSKSELIHFESHKTTLNQMIILLNNTIIKSKTCVQWLKVWLNRKLNFKVYVQTKIATVTRTLHSLFRLMNSEWELNVKSEKQLYLTCVTSISDYDAEIWWNNQKSYLVKFRKLQNAALRKILNAFRTSSINAMQIEVEIPSMKMQLDQKCKNYAIWIVKLPKKHSIRKRTFISYSSQYSIELNLDLNASKYLNWNETKTNLPRKVKKCKDRLTQIYWILNKVQKTLNSIKEIEISHFKKPWDQEIEHLAKIQTEFARSETSETINTHYRKLERITKKMKSIVMYIDASQIRKKIAEVETEIETTVIFTHEPVRCSKATSVSGKSIITKAKLQAISDAIAMCSEKALKNSKIWMYMNSQMTLQRLNAKSNVNAKLFDDIRQNLTNLRQNQCQIRIQWILSRKNIIGNEKADQLIKSAAQELPVIDNMKAIIISFVKKQICKEAKVQWLNVWKSSIKKGNQYRKHISNVNLSQKSLKEFRKIDRLTFSIFIQSKMRHNYFKSYLHRLSENNSNKCYEICNASQTSEHLLLNCKHYRSEQIKLKKKTQLKNTDIILTLFIIKIERIATLEYLKNTRIATRKWLLETKE